MITSQHMAFQRPHAHADKRQYIYDTKTTSQFIYIKHEHTIYIIHNKKAFIYLVP